MSARYSVEWRMVGGRWQEADAFRWLWRARRFLAPRLVNPKYVQEWRVVDHSGQAPIVIQRHVRYKPDRTGLWSTCENCKRHDWLKDAGGAMFLCCRCFANRDDLRFPEGAE